MKVFIDLEFTGLHKDTEIISLGLVTECGRTFYAEFNDYDLNKCSENDKKWLKENVVSELIYNNIDKVVPEYCVYDSDYIRVKGSKEDIKGYLNVFFKSIEEEVILVGDCMSYDIVLFNSIFGHSFDIPDNIFYIPIDICTMMVDRGIGPDIDRSSIYSGKNNQEKHNALHDAKTIQKWYNRLNMTFSNHEFKKEYVMDFTPKDNNDIKNFYKDILKVEDDGNICNIKIEGEF